jgi:hypothetical protein
MNAHEAGLVAARRAVQAFGADRGQGSCRYSGVIALATLVVEAATGAGR